MESNQWLHLTLHFQANRSGISDRPEGSVTVNHEALTLPGSLQMDRVGGSSSGLPLASVRCGLWGGPSASISWLLRPTLPASMEAQAIVTSLLSCARQPHGTHCPLTSLREREKSETHKHSQHEMWVKGNHSLRQRALHVLESVLSKMHVLPGTSECDLLGNRVPAAVVHDEVILE